MVENRCSVLMVVRPGPVSDGLQVLLSAVPRLSIADPVESGQAALKDIEVHRPAIILIDFALANYETPRLVQQIKATWPQIRCVVLTDNRWQEEAARKAGADITLRQGAAPAEIFDTFEKLANPPAK
jgi:DNA-binding NarL/FixJ family response regulator